MLVVRAGIVHIPVARPQRVAARTWHFRVRESVRRPSAALKKEMTDGGPRDGETVALEDLQKIRHILSFLPPFGLGHLLRMVSKGPTQFEGGGPSQRAAGKRECALSSADPRALQFPHHVGHR